ncbi:MAG TPA: efflux RND transporter permease subunit [Candidatus Paceibacterota bacterium]|nr:efflux RND transporter permease subunit [Candidatus Paceibacterota bacterium]
MWEFFIKNQKFTGLFLITIIAIGLFSVINIPRESAPEVEIPVGVITTILPGAPASDIESLITNKLERGLSSLDDVKKVTSQSQDGVSSITVEFDARADIDASIQDLKDTIDSLMSELPADAEDPIVTEVSFVNMPIMTFSVAGDRSDAEFTELAHDLEDTFESITGVSKIELQGVRDREVTLVIEPKALELYSITLLDITNALRNANTILPVGSIENDGVRYNVALEGDIADISDIENIGVATRDGQPIFMRDVATIIDGLSPATTLSRLSVGGNPSQNAITLSVYKQSGGDVTKITKNVRTTLTELQKENGLLNNLDVVILQDSGKQIEDDLIDLGTSGLQTVILVLILLVLTIGLREGILAGISIPVSFIFGFIGLYVSGNTINFLSLFALILGIGILVDSAIVMVEGINSTMKKNPSLDSRLAAIQTIRSFSAPLISGTLTTVAMFSGLFIVSGVTGEFISSIPFTIISILLASIFIALAIIPYFASQYLHPHISGNLESRQAQYAQKVEQWYKEKLNAIIGHTKVEKLIFRNLRILLIIAILLPVFGIVKVVFFQQSDADFITIEVENPEGTTKEVTDTGIRRIEEILYTQPNIDSFMVTVGSGSQYGAGGSNEKRANILISLSDDRDQKSIAIIDSLREALSSLRDLTITISQQSDGPPTGAPIVIKYLGDDLVTMNRIARESAEIIKQIPNITNITTSTNNNSTEYVLTLDDAKIAAFGLNPFLISQTARTAVFGTEATSITTLDDDIRVMVTLNVSGDDTFASDTTNETTIDALTRVSIPTPHGTIPLSSFATISLRESSTIINHEDGMRVVEVTADVTSGGNARDLQAEALRMISEHIDMPAGIVLSTGGGEAEESNKAFMEMFLALIVGLLLMVGIIVLQFNSYLHTRYVFSIIPYSLIGIFFGLALTNNPLSFPSLMGFIALSGIVVNNSILLIDVMNVLRKENPHMSTRDVVIEGSASRIRPILLTSATTIIGMIPLTYAGDMWAPLAYAVIFGLIVSVAVTLVIVPILYNRNPGSLDT